MPIHEHFMKICLDLGRKSLELGNPPVGALVVEDEKIIGEGLELGKTKNDITYHAEIEAIRDAIKRTGRIKLNNTILYTTHEPCLMCSYAIRHYQIHTLVYGASVDHIGGDTSQFGLLNTNEIPIWQKPPQIIQSILKEECQSLTKDFLSRKS